MSHVNNSSHLALPRKHHKHGEHGKHALVEQDEEFDEVDEPGRNYGLWGFGFSFLLVVTALIQGVFSVFNELCPDPSAGSCSRVPGGEAFPVLNVVFVIVAFIFAALSTLFSVEAIARKEHQGLAYAALIVITFVILFFVSGIYQDFIEKLVLRFI